MKWLCASTFVAICVGGCVRMASPSPDGSRLRVINIGSRAIDNLVVLFPSDQVGFGGVSIGTTTEYRNVPNGVFRYAAYRFTIDGATINQPVIDWVGEKPLDGKAFTYSIEVVSASAGTHAVRLVSVAQDQ
jgi:hypothetical protein